MFCNLRMRVIMDWETTRRGTGIYSIAEKCPKMIPRGGGMTQHHTEQATPRHSSHREYSCQWSIAREGAARGPALAHHELRHRVV